MSEDGKVIRLVDVRAGYSIEGQEQLADWLIAWANCIKRGEFKPIRSVVCVFESSEGEIGLISQSLEHLDRARVVGRLHTAAHRRIEGLGDITDLEVQETLPK